MVAPPVLVLACLAGLAWFLVRYVPNGVPIIISRGPPRTYVGLLTVPKGGWDYALFNEKASLIENERLSELGQQKVFTTCVVPDRARATLDQKLSDVVADQGGIKALWIEFDAKPYTSNGICQERHSNRRGTFGRYLRIISVRRLRQIPCPEIRFLILKRRCLSDEAAYE